MTEPLLPEHEPEILAAELALGLLEGPELAEALEREAGDAGFAALVARWRDRTTAWMEALPEEAVGNQHWSRIEAALGRDSTVAALPWSHNAATARVSSQTRWRPLALLASAASVVLAVLLAVVITARPNPMPVEAGDRATANPPASIAQIAGQDGAPLISAAYYPETNRLVMRTSDFATPSKGPELWVLDKAGKPYSLGLVESRDTLTIELSPQIRQLLVDGATIAITLEDRNGVPHAAPSGKIIGTARLSRL